MHVPKADAVAEVRQPQPRPPLLYSRARQVEGGNASRIVVGLGGGGMVPPGCITSK